MMVCKTIYIGSNPILDSVFGTRIGLRDVIVAHVKCGFEFRRTPHIAGREVSHRSHKPSVSGSIPDPATKKFGILKNISYLC